MKLVTFFIVLVLAGSTISVFAASIGNPINETAKTAPAVIAVDHHWSRAEENGNTSWLGAMLMPEYRTVEPDGKVGTKSMLLAAAAKHGATAGMREQNRKQDAAWRNAHPIKTSAVIEGDTALLTFSDPKTGHIRSSDLFVYKDGRWHALYSSHNKIDE